MNTRAKLPELPFTAIVNGRETIVDSYTYYGGIKLYRARGCGLVQASAITPIPALNWGGKKQTPPPLEAFDAASVPPPRRMWEAPTKAGADMSARFGPAELLARVPQTARAHYRRRCLNTRAWLEGVLRYGPVAAKEILARAKANGIPERSLRRAKKWLKAKAFKRGGRNGREGAVWLWRL